MNAEINEELIKVIAKLKAEKEVLNEQIKLLNEKLVGKRSAKNKSGHNGPTLFDEAEVEAAHPEPDVAGKEASEFLDIVPAKVQVIRARQKVYA